MNCLLSSRAAGNSNAQSMRPAYSCSTEKSLVFDRSRWIEKQPLPNSIQRHVNFTTSVSTNLNLIFIGDSIMSQFAQVFDSAAIREGESRRTLHYALGRDANLVHDCQTMVRTRGGGVSAHWRTTRFLLEESRVPFAHCKHNWKAWSEVQALTFLNQKVDGGFHSPHMQATRCQYGVCRHDGDPSRTGRVNEFDAAIYRAPLGWIALNDVTEEDIVKTLRTSHRLLGARTFIVTTQPLSNNVQGMEEWPLLIKFNRMLRRVASEFTRNSTEIDYVLVMELGNLTSQLMMHNAKHIGFDVTLPMTFATEDRECDSQEEVLLERVQYGTWPPSFAQVCSNQTLMDDGNCPRNRLSPGTSQLSRQLTSDETICQLTLPEWISEDGMHWCMETVGARYTASVACLLGCVYNGDTRPNHDEAKECERRCNEQFMSLEHDMSEDSPPKDVSLWSSSPGH